MITKVAFIALPAIDPKRAGAFYKDVLGLVQSEWDVDAWVEVDTPCGSTIALVQDPEMAPYIALETDDIDAELDRLTTLGVEIVHGPAPLVAGETPFCREAVIRDSEGNLLKLHQRLAPELDGCSCGCGGCSGGC